MEVSAMPSNSVSPPHPTASDERILSFYAAREDSTTFGPCAHFYEDSGRCEGTLVLDDESLTAPGAFITIECSQCPAVGHRTEFRFLQAARAKLADHANQWARTHAQAEVTADGE